MQRSLTWVLRKRQITANSTESELLMATHLQDKFRTKSPCSIFYTWTNPPHWFWRADKLSLIEFCMADNICPPPLPCTPTPMHQSHIHPYNLTWSFYPHDIMGWLIFVDVFFGILIQRKISRNIFGHLSQSMIQSHVSSEKSKWNINSIFWGK